MKEYALKGVRTEEINVIPDERGSFAEALRRDQEELLEGDWIEQANISLSYPNIVIAWHKHVRGQVDYFLVLKGAVKICAFEEETGRMTEIIANGSKPTIVRIPGKYLHGSETVSNEPSLTVYFVTKIYDYQNPDENRRPWNDPSIIPTEINGKKTDSRAGKPWDWFLPPHK